jgi:hypothetical protein
VSTAMKWNIIIKSPLGNNEALLDFQVDGKSLTGTISGSGEVNEIFDAEIDGDQLRWSARVSKPMPLKVAFSATVDGDKISGNAKSPFISAPFSGQRC